MSILCLLVFSFSRSAFPFVSCISSLSEHPAHCPLFTKSSSIRWLSLPEWVISLGAEDGDFSKSLHYSVGSTWRSSEKRSFPSSTGTVGFPEIQFLVKRQSRFLMPCVQLFIFQSRADAVITSNGGKWIERPGRQPLGVAPRSWYKNYLCVSVLPVPPPFMDIEDSALNTFIYPLWLIWISWQ